MCVCRNRWWPSERTRGKRESECVKKMRFQLPEVRSTHSFGSVSSLHDMPHSSQKRHFNELGFSATSAAITRCFAASC